MVSLREKPTTCPICRHGVLAAYRSGPGRRGRAQDGASRHPQSAPTQIEISGRQSLQVCGACGGSVLRAW